ncbi:MAG TPA: tetratricopeptide repeat protein [Chitinophagaceae bacterium]|nr:tetratricopeptide repeat protein [Chitinophagaceae bacterium]
MIKKLLLSFLLTWHLPVVAQKVYRDIDSMQGVISKLPANQLKEKATLLEKTGLLYLNTNDYTNATSCFTQSLTLADQLSDSVLMANCYRNMGVVNFYQQNYEKGENYFQKALAIYVRKDNTEQQATLLKNLGDIYLQNSDSANANKNYNQALVLFKKINDKRGEAVVYSNQSILCGSNYQQKIELALKAKKLFDEYPTANVIPVTNLGNIGVAYLDLARYDMLRQTKPSAIIPADRTTILKMAEEYLLLAISTARKSGDTENAGYFTGVLAELQEQKGDYKNAYLNFRIYQNTMDSIFSQQNKNTIASLESQREIDLKNKTIENNELQIRNQRNNMLFLAAGLLLLTFIGVLLYRQSRIQKKTNMALSQLNRELDEANKVKARFFGILSHDLRSPVANLINFLQLQKRQPGLLTEEQKTDREQKISRSAENLLEIMEGMLLWSKGQMEHFTPTISAVPAHQLFDYISKYYAGVQQVQLHFEAAQELVIQTDENYLQTIMQNLTANAVKALQENPAATIWWKAWKENDKTFLSITDNGPGISPEQAKNLFEDTGVSGSRHGLGLHIVRDLSKAIQCDISVQPGDEGKGTRFVLSLS